MNNNLTGYAQIILSIVFILGYFWVLMEFTHGRILIPAEWKDTLGNLLSLLTATVLQICNFWFSRHREGNGNNNNI